MVMITIDGKLFAHIHNDAFLLGSDGLQGNRFSTTIGYLSQFIERNKGDKSKPLSHLLSTCSYLTEIESILKDFSNNKELNLPEFQEFTQTIPKKALDLKDDEYLLLPGGWVDSNGGHAMIYQLKKNTAGDFLFSIHNSGSGLQYHDKYSSQEKELYNPTLTFKITAEAIKSDHFIGLIDGIFTVQISTDRMHTHIDASHLYEKIIFPNLMFLNAQRMPNLDSEEKWRTAGQISGTCAQHSIHQMLKARFEDKDEYRQFIYQFKVYALDDYIESLRKTPNLLNSPKIQSQLIKGIRHQLRLLNLTKTTSLGEPLFTIETKKSESARLEGYLKELRGLIDPIKKTINSQYGYNTKPEKWAREIKFPKSQSWDMCNTTNYVQANIPAFIDILGGDDLLNEMENLIQHCNRLNEQKDYQAIYEQLNHFFIQLPLPEISTSGSVALPYYQSIDSQEKAYTFYQKMNELQSLYFKTYKPLIQALIHPERAILPSMYLVKLSIFSVSDYINAQFPLVPTKRFHDLILPIEVNESLHRCNIAMNHPALDKRYLHICQLYTVHDSYKYRFHYNSLNYYLSIINTDPRLERILLSFYSNKYPNGLPDKKMDSEIIKRQLRSLYYFITHLDELKLNPDFKVLTDKFMIQDEMEQLCGFFSNYFSSYFSKFDEQKKSQLGFKLCSISKELELVSTASECYDCLDVKSINLRLSKYHLEEKLHLKKYDYSQGHSNKTQLDQLDEYINNNKRPDVEWRELNHLRRVTSTQLPLTIDYFQRHLEKMSRPEIQTYIEHNICQPGLLLSQLTDTKSTQFFLQFDSFIKEGLHFYDKKGQLTQSSLFFIRLGYLVNQYAEQYDSLRYGHRLETYNQSINQLILCQTDPAIQATLHQYRFLALTANKNSINDPQAFERALISYFHIQLSQNLEEKIDADTQFQRSRAHYNFMRILCQQQHSLTSQLLIKILNTIIPKGQLPKNAHISGAYPLYLVKQRKILLYSINVERGVLYNNQNMALCSPPVDILNHPIARKFGLNNGSCVVSRNGEAYLFDQPPIKMRFIKEHNQCYVQKSWTDSSGKEKWYELTSSSTEHAEFWALPPMTHYMSHLNPLIYIPKFMKERDSLFWRSLTDDTFVMSNTENKINYEGSSKTGFVHSVNLNMDLQESSWIDEKMNCFEYRYWINVFGNDDQYRIQLHRYGLTFSASNNKKTITWSLHGCDYELVKESGALSNEIAHLIFKHLDQERCIIAIQRFTNSGYSTSSEYYSFQHDIQMSIPQNMVYKLDKKPDNKCWQYTGTEQCIVYKMQDGQPIPSTSAEALYLCYVYLGANQPEKAWAVLTDCDKRLGGLTGAYDELRYLQWIIHALPYQENESDSKAVRSNPPLVACQLKAIALLTQYSRLDKSISFPEPISTPNTINWAYEKKDIENTRAFYQNIKSTIYSLYSDLQKMRRELDADFTLNDTEAKSLLDYYHDDRSASNDIPVAMGALGYEWVQLNLNVLRKEWSHLEANELTRSVSPYEIRRKNEIDLFLQQHQGVASIQSRLIYKPIDLSLPKESVLIDYVELNEPLKVGELVLENQTTLDFSEAIKALKINLLPSEFLKNIIPYLKIATNHKETLDGTSARATLSNFCKNTLKNNRDNQASGLVLLCNVIYRLISSNYIFQQYQKNKFYHLRHLINFARDQLPEPPPIEIPELADDTSHLMISAQTLWDATPQDVPIVAPDVTVSTLNPWVDATLLNIQTQWRDDKTIFNSGCDKTKPNVDPVLSDENHAGRLKYDAMKALQRIAEKDLDSLSFRAQLTTNNQAIWERESALQSKLLEELLSLGCQGPSDPALQTHWAIDILSGKRKTLTLNDLLTLYFHADVARYRFETGLDKADINRLHALLIEYVSATLHCQQCKRVNEQLVNVTHATEEERPQALYLLAKALLTENKVDAVKEPALTLFQYHEKILLRPQQKEVLDRLLTHSSTDSGSFNETVEKIIMGGGKSKIILPTLAQKKATGRNLVIIEVPRSLLHTNYIDLKATSSKLFNQNACLFEFNRDSQCSSKRLEQLHMQLTEMMVNQDYMVTTGDSMQSLELKYLELLMTKPDAKRDMIEWTAQVTWAERLILLLKHRGDVIIDEAHQGLRVNTKLNYTIGEPRSIAPILLNEAIHLYQFFSCVTIRDASEKTISLDKALLKRTVFNEEAILDAAMQELISQLMTHNDSPIRTEISRWISNHGEMIRPLLDDYLHNKGENIPAFILESPPRYTRKNSLL